MATDVIALAKQEFTETHISYAIERTALCRVQRVHIIGKGYSPRKKQTYKFEIDQLFRQYRVFKCVYEKLLDDRDNEHDGGGALFFTREATRLIARLVTQYRKQLREDGIPILGDE